MRVGLISWGTEGDIRPFFALARALVARGHTVRFEYVNVEGRTFEALSEHTGVPGTPFGVAYFREHRDEIRRASEESLRYASPPQQFELIVRDLMDPIADELLARSLAIAAESDVVVGHVLAHPVATAAEKQGVPYVALALQPIYRSRLYPPAGAPDLGRWLNPLTWRLADYVIRRTINPRVAAQRASLSLPEAPPFDVSRFGPGQRAIVAVSPSLFARPADWSDRIALTGSLALDERAGAWDPPEALRGFLAHGEPVFASFGSMFSLSDAMAVDAVRTFVAAADRAGERMIVQCPSAVRAQAPESERVLFIERAPHAALFPRCKLIVHHGGAGTTQSALLAGRPSVVVAHAADQFYWADQLHARGVASKPLVRKRLTARSLADRVQWALARPALTARAGELSRALAAEDGVAATVEAIERGA